MAVEPSSVRINLTRDELFDDFTLQTLRDRYMVPGETSPQHAFARASAAFADDDAHAQRLYDYVSKGWFMFATPLLSNGGTARGLPISCFLSTAEDSREGIFDHWTETGWLSSVGGGVGGYWGGLRSNGEKTSHGSSSTGAIPFIATVDRLILAVSQGGTRRGSYAAYLDISHPEIEEFITFRKPSGDENRKATNLHNAVCVTDEFMVAVRDDLPFDLRDPKSKNIIKTLQARELWHLLMETRKQTGEPYLFFVDTANRALPEPQKKKGLRVYQSNLCVAPDTPILTEAGYKPIGSLKGEEVDVWNGEAWSRGVRLPDERHGRQGRTDARLVRGRQPPRLHALPQVL
jgi:ribonucleoside-diphosphate reductase alpha chain